MFKVITLATSKGRREIHTGPQFCGTAFVTGAFATEIGIVDLHPTGQAFARIPLHHHLHELVFELQAVVWVTPRRRPSSRPEIPPLLCVRWYMARKQVRSDTLVEAKIVPTIVIKILSDGSELGVFEFSLIARQRGS